jgi:hypothetical protein
MSWPGRYVVVMVLVTKREILKKGRNEEYTQWEYSVCLCLCGVFFDCCFLRCCPASVRGGVEGCGLVWGQPHSLLRCCEGLVPVVIPMCYIVRTRNITIYLALAPHSAVTVRYAYRWVGPVGVRGVAWRALGGASFPGPSLSIMHRASHIDR